MKIVVAIKKVIDYKVRVRLDESGSDVETNNVKKSINPFDEVALEQAIRFKEAGLASEVVVISISGEPCEDIIRHAYAMGADRGIYIQSEESLQSNDVANILAKIIKYEKPQLVLLGKQSIDNDAGSVGASLAAKLDYPHIGFASKVELSENSVSVTRDVEAGKDVYQAKLPAVISVDLTLCDARFVKLPQIMKSRSKPIDNKDDEVLYEDFISRINIEKPTIERKNVRVTTANEFVKLLNEAK